MHLMPSGYEISDVRQKLFYPVIYEFNHYLPEWFTYQSIHTDILGQAFYMCFGELQFRASCICFTSFYLNFFLTLSLQIIFQVMLGI